MAVHKDAPPHVETAHAPDSSQTRLSTYRLRPDIGFWRGILAVALCDVLITSAFTVFLGWRFRW